MKRTALFGILALLVQSAGAAAPNQSLAEDVADVATRVCFDYAIGRLRWDPADLHQAELVLKSLGLKPGIPSGVIESFGRNTAATFNRAVLASRSNGSSHVLLAMGGMMPGCRVTAAGIAGSVTAAQVAESLVRPQNGWTAAPEFDRPGGPVERRSFVRRAEGGRVIRLDLLTATESAGTFRLMAMMLDLPPVKLPKRSDRRATSRALALEQAHLSAEH